METVPRNKKSTKVNINAFKTIGRSVDKERQKEDDGLLFEKVLFYFILKSFFPPPSKKFN